MATWEGHSPAATRSMVMEPAALSLYGSILDYPLPHHGLPPCHLYLSALPSPQSTMTPSTTLNSSTTTFSSVSGICVKFGKSHCKSTRIHSECSNQMCHQHCLEAGGCQVKGHGTVEKRKCQAMSPFSHPSLSSSPAPEILTAVDMFANLQHVSQMTAAFTKHYALEQA